MLGTFLADAGVRNHWHNTAVPRIIAQLTYSIKYGYYQITWNRWTDGKFPITSQVSFALIGRVAFGEHDLGICFSAGPGTMPVT
jgi:hypothetical protein